MRIQVTILLLFMSAAFAVDDKGMNELFKKYDLIMDQKKVELVDEVFTQKFLKGSGGKDKFIEKVKELPQVKVSKPRKVTWRKGLKGKMHFAKSEGNSEFIIVEENGKLKIDGTLSDGD